MRSILVLLLTLASLGLAHLQAQRVEPDAQAQPSPQPDMSLPDEDWANHARFTDDNARVVAAAPTAEPRIVFMGNSITEGWLSADSSFWARHPNYVNRGISGQTTEQMLVRFRPDVIALAPAVVVIHAGVNDFAYNTGPMSPEETFGNIVSMTQLALANRIAPVIASIPHATSFGWRPGAGNRVEEIAALNERLRAYAEREQIPYVDYHAAMSNAEGELATEYAADSVHPTLKGYRVMVPLVEAGIGEALR